MVFGSGAYGQSDPEFRNVNNSLAPNCTDQNTCVAASFAGHMAHGTFACDAYNRPPPHTVSIYSLDYYGGSVPKFYIKTICDNDQYSPTTQTHVFKRYPSCPDGSTDFPCESFYVETPKVQCDPCEVGKTNESNPVDPLSGNKAQTELDYVGGGDGALSFRRYYNSLGAYRSDAHFATSWRHSYSRYLDEEPDIQQHTRFSAPSSNESASYKTASDACTQGFNAIKADAWDGAVSGATATFSGGNICKITENVGGSTETVAYFSVRSKVPFAAFTAPSTIKTITRPSGESVRFEDDNGVWVNPFDPALKLEENAGVWTYTTKNDTRETYNSSGLLTSIEFRNGQTETLTYDLAAAQGGDDDASTLDRVTGPFGHTLDFQYDSEGRLDTVITPDGDIVYTYGNYNNLATVTYPDSTVRSYIYDQADLYTHLTGIEDENGDRFATWVYDTAGRATLSEHAGGKEQVTLAYNTDGTATLTTANGATRTYGFTVVQGEPKLTTLTNNACSTCSEGDIASRSYDSNGYLDEATDWNGNITQTIRDNEGLVTSLVEAKSSTEQRTTTMTWNTTYRLPDQVVSPKNTTDYTYDTDGNLLTLEVSSGTLSRDWALTYNANGQVLTINGPRTDISDITTLAYYNCTTGDECGQLQSVTNALSQVTTYDTYDAGGRVTRMTDPNGLESDFVYDARGNVTSVTLTPTSGTARVTTMTYDDASQLETLSTPEGMVLTYTYDAAHYLRSITDNLGNKIEYDYDAMGNLRDEDTYDPSQVLKRAVSYAYDLNNRLDTITSGGHLTNLTIDKVGNLTNEVDPKLASTQHSYDALNRLEQTIDALSGVISYGYDDHDNLTAATAANGANTTYEYDDLDNLKKEISPDRGTTTYTYDEAGNLETKTDARGKVTTYTYDALNRLTLESLDGSATIAYEYDTGANAKGRLTKITDSTGSTTWAYSNFGEVTQKVQTIGSVGLTTAYSYDTSGRLSTMTLPSGKIITYGYNSFQPNSVTVDSTTILSSASYDPFGPVTGWSWGNGSTASRVFDQRGLPTAIAFAGDTQTLGFDATGQVTSQADSVFDVTYDYDLLGRITDFDNNNTGGSLPDSQDFAYDGNANRTSLTEDGTAYSYTNQANSNRLLSTAGPTAKTYTHDAAGNVTGDGTHTYGYDDRGRLVSVGTGTATYEHNGQGQRVKKDNGTVTLFAYDEFGNLIGEYDSTGTALLEHVWFNGAPVAVMSGTDKHYVHTDHLGTPRVITDGNTVIWRWHSDAFGSTPASEDPDGDSTLFTYNLRFPGQYRDSETGLHYNYFRTYDPSTGRYLESDPVGLAGGLNTYGYVAGNPLSAIDPFGLFEVVGDPCLGLANFEAMMTCRSKPSSQRFYKRKRNLERHAERLQRAIANEEDCECKNELQGLFDNWTVRPLDYNRIGMSASISITRNQTGTPIGGYTKFDYQGTGYIRSYRFNHEFAHMIPDVDSLPSETLGTTRDTRERGVDDYVGRLLGTQGKSLCVSQSDLWRNIGYRQ